MKLFIIRVFVVLIRLIYAPLKLFKTQNKILYLSRQSDEKSTDYLMLEECIKKLNPRIKQVFRLCRLKDESSVSLSYVFSVLGDMCEMATAKVIITDTYSIPVSCLKHKNGTHILQVWHAMGAVKKFSLQAAGKAQGRDLGVAKAMHMHENYTCVLAPSQVTAKAYCEAFGCSEDKIKILNLPRVDIILNGENRREEFLKLNPQYEDKKIVGYIPTFRNNDENFAQNLFTGFENNNNFSLVVSPHPLSETAKKGDFEINGNFTSLDIMKLSDIIITDYSACAFEAALLSKPLYFYIPDYKVYKGEQGLNFDMEEEMPSVSFENETMLIKALTADDYDFNMLNQFCDKYIEYKKTNNTERLSKYICSLLE